MTPNRSPAVYELEREIATLSVDDKLRLRDYIDRQIRAAALGKSVSEIEAELEEMANDPDIQRELAEIELEFASTSMDGLQG
jgi:predicted transcriptional regulator